MKVRHNIFWIIGGGFLLGMLFMVWATLSQSSVSSKNITIPSSSKHATRSLLFPDQHIIGQTYGREDADENSWNFCDFFFSSDIILPHAADGVILYQQGFEFLTLHNGRHFGRQALSLDVINTVIDEEHSLLVIGSVERDVIIWDSFTQTQREYYTGILGESAIISIGYHPQTRYCAVLYQNFDVAVFAHNGEQVFSYTSPAKSQPGDRTGQNQNLYFRDPHTLYFFDRDALMAIDLTTNTVTTRYNVPKNLETHSGYQYYFNSSNNTVSIFSEYCAGCDLGGEILVVDVDNFAALNKLYTEEYGQSLSFCKYYDKTFITASRIFEAFTIHKITEASD